MFSQLVDTTAVITITHFYAHALPGPPDGRSISAHLLIFIATGYAFKFFAALLDTIPIYIVVPILSRYLRIDPLAEPRADKEETALTG